MKNALTNTRFLLTIILVSMVTAVSLSGAYHCCYSNVQVVISHPDSSGAIKSGAQKSRGGTLTNLGTMEIKNNLDNQTATTTNLGSGTYIFSGTETQSISGPVTFQNLTLNNTAGFTTDTDIQVNGVLTLTNGKLILGSNHLTLGSEATVEGSPSSAAMVVVTGTGEFRKTFPSSPTFPLNFTFPVGDADNTAEYSPVALNFTSATFNSGNYLGVSLKNLPDPNPEIATGNYLNRYWVLNNNGIGGTTSCDLTFTFTDADVTGTKASLYCVKTSPELVEYNHYLNNNQLTGTVSGFSRFTGADQLVTTTITLFLEGLYNPATGLMNKAKDYSGGNIVDKYPGTVADLVTVELHAALDYSTVIYSVEDAELNQNGTITIDIPGSYKGASYYITVKQRNHIETVSVSPVSYTSNDISYNFSTAASQAYGNNLKQLATGVYGIFTGDVNQDGVVNITDRSLVNSGVIGIIQGYYPEDVNGDGSINVTDRSLVNSAVISIVARSVPQ